ncbi:MAG: hypothetical protein GVY17_07175 [Cyanobacteria bacterium]|jgi:hypothetical protein|nr:hypothetical protein [Cyanobacteria bacterium GSL.Bin21]
MFIADKLIYLQLEKTACTHIAYLLRQCIGGTQFFKHNCLSENVTSKVIVGSVRNPWDWYVSLWAFSMKGDSKIYESATQRSLRRAFKIFSGCEDPDHFKSWLSKDIVKRSFLTALNAPKGLLLEWLKDTTLWRNSYQNPNDPKKFRQWLKLMCDPSKAYHFDLGYAQNPIKPFAGFMTYRYFRIFSINFFRQAKIHSLVNLKQLKEFDKTYNTLDRTILCENLESDLLNVFKQAGYQLSDEQLNLIYEISKTKINSSKRFDSSYYDRETIDLVAEREKFIIEKYSYKPPIKIN